jgi:MspA
MPAAKYFSSLMAVVLCVVTALATAGTASAGMDSQRSSTLRSGDTMNVQMWDTFLNGVTPMDRNRLTREWFHSGRAVYEVTGGAAEEFAGTLELGYEIGFPWSLGVALNFSYTTPNAYVWDVPVTAPLTSLVTPNLFPGASISADVGNGPGIQEVVTFSVEVSGPGGTVAVANAHGTVTGAAGGVLLRPFARLIWPDRGSIATYGEQWNMN